MILNGSILRHKPFQAPKAPNPWLPFPKEQLPLPLQLNMARQQRKVMIILSREVFCGWDKKRRRAFRITSDSGVTVEWSPTSRALTSWDPKIVQGGK